MESSFVTAAAKGKQLWMLSREKHSKISKNNFPENLRLFSDSSVYRGEEVTLVVVWVGGGFILKWSRHFFKNLNVSLPARGSPHWLARAFNLATQEVYTFQERTG
jgi:hypothetical protein